MRASKRQQQRKEEKERNRNRLEEYWQYDESLLYLTPPLVCDAASSCDDADGHGANTLMAGSAIIAFDMDHTLIKTKSGRVFPTGPDDWQWWDASVPETLKRLKGEGKKLVIISNQRGVSSGQTCPEGLKKKITAMFDSLGFDMQVFFATANDQYRKPATGMWDFMLEYANDDIEPVNSHCEDLPECMYVGDMAGRPFGWDGAGIKKDRYCSDRKFAFNVAIDFQCPEEFFLGRSPIPFIWGGVDPRTIPLEPLGNGEEVCDGGFDGIARCETEVVVFVGSPGCGKTSFAKRFLIPKGYVHVNQDTMGSKAKCIREAKAALSNGKSVVIDNTNADRSTREHYIAAAKSHGAGARCYWFQTSLDIAHHLNKIRTVMTSGQRKPVPEVAFRSFTSRLQEPSTDEGFSEVNRVRFHAHFESERQRKVFMQWT